MLLHSYTTCNLKNQGGGSRDGVVPKSTHRSVQIIGVRCTATPSPIGSGAGVGHGAGTCWCSNDANARLCSRVSKGARGADQHWMSPKLAVTSVEMERGALRTSLPPSLLPSSLLEAEVWCEDDSGWLIVACSSCCCPLSWVRRSSFMLKSAKDPSYLIPHLKTEPSLLPICLCISRR